MKKMNIIQAIRFTLDTEENVERMLVHLNDYGYVVIAEVATLKEVEQQKNRFWEYIEGLETREDRGRILRNDPETWKDENWLGNKSTGIIRSPNFCHSEFMWTSRTFPKVKQAFSEIWKSDEMLVSYDAGNAFRPWKYNPQWVTEGNWWHVDQNCRKGPSRQGRVCVQGLVTYYDVTEESGGLCVIPGSHLYHKEVCERSPSGKLLQDYVYIAEDDPILKLNPPVIVGAKAGDLILWDSRLAHCNTPSTKAPARDEMKYKENILPSNISGNTSTASLERGSWTNLKINNPKLTSADSDEDKENSNSPVSDLEWIHITDGSHNYPHDGGTDFELIDQSDASSPRVGKIGTSISNVILSEAGRQKDSLITEKVHESNSSTEIELIRLVSYVCMLPRSFATPAIIRSRKRGFLYRVPTSHWPTELIPLHMTDDRNYNTVNWRDVSPEIMKLIGFASWEIQLRKFRVSEVCRDFYNMVR